MMKKLLLVLTLLLWSTVGSAVAAQYQFEDMIDTWGSSNLNSARITQNNPLDYTHDINDEVNLIAGDLVTEAWLELKFIDDENDDHWNYWWFGWHRGDNREYVSVGFDGAGWEELGEVDTRSYDIVLDIDWLNADGLLDVTINVRNNRNNADVLLDSSRLYGTAETAPVPEPATLFLLATGLVGLAGSRRKARK